MIRDVFVLNSVLSIDYECNTYMTKSRSLDRTRFRYETSKRSTNTTWMTRSFQMHFQKSYDEDFYEFPLDGSVTSSLKNFTTFCRITKEKVKCWEEQCHLQRQSIPWTTDVHICLFRRKQFEDSLDCLKYVMQFVKSIINHRFSMETNCLITFEKIENSAEKKYLSNLHLSASNIHQYHQLNKQCYFQICQLKCRVCLSTSLFFSKSC
ncbi:unnamed protein product [Anisakis simplex]|uniref:Ras-associating domain-containing protein n=1 Tax=Anisakis simplex TaxID=6269 RepID=A0A0M3JD19_ANISI|nr:unnamed protein product [Anisakis simplex]